MKAFRNGASLSSAASACLKRPHRSPTRLNLTRISDNALARRGDLVGGGRILPSISSRIPTSRSYSVDHGTPKSSPPPFAFAFDIDGVLLHVTEPIPGATDALKQLQEYSIPFILLTNGGGKHETDRVKDLSNRLGIELTTDNFVQSHTPFQELVRHGHNSEGLRDKNILVTGSDAAKCRDIAERYGFKHVIIPADILVAQPTIWPFEPLMKEVYAATARPLPSPNPKIDAIFVFNDPRDWALDIQIISDLLMSQQGVLGTYSPNNENPDLPNRGWQRDGQPHLFFSNPDLFWSAAYPLPRFGQGAFQAALAGVWDQVTGGKAELERTVIGKPYARTYGFAERVLNAHRAKILGAGQATLEPLQRVYMVGDNPASDIRGANEYVSPLGTKWSSILVGTGVYSFERAGPPEYWPDFTVKDVKEAVEMVLAKEVW